MDEVGVRALAHSSAKARTMARQYFIAIVLELVVMGNDLLCKDECRTSHDDILASGGNHGRMVEDSSSVD